MDVKLKQKIEETIAISATETPTHIPTRLGKNDAYHSCTHLNQFFFFWNSVNRNCSYCQLELLIVYCKMCVMFRKLVLGCVSAFQTALPTSTFIF